MKVADSIREKWLKQVRIFWKERGIRSFVLLNKWKLLCLRLCVAFEVFYCSAFADFDYGHWLGCRFWKSE